MVIIPQKKEKSTFAEAIGFMPAEQNLTQMRIEDGLFHTIVLKRKCQKKQKQKIAAATYLYQADSDGERGEIQFDFERKTAEIIRLADWDNMISQPFAKIQSPIF